MGKKHDVEYMIKGGAMGDTKVKAQLDQRELGKLLLQDNIVLLSVNKPKNTYSRKKR